MTDIFYRVEEGEEEARLDRYLAARFSERSRTFWQKRIAAGDVTVNDRPVKPSYEPAAGDGIRIRVPEVTPVAIAAEDIPLDIVYEDSDVIVVNKPKGMVVHPAPGHMTGTLVNALLYHCTDLSGINGVERPGIVHRIDRDTTGLLVVCKNDAAHTAIAAQLAVHSLQRRYRAIVYGNLREDEGTVNAPIGRSPADRKKMAVVPGGREAVTHWKVLERFGDCTYIECRLETGRTHQIRVHMTKIGHPLVGDTVYGPAEGKLAGVSLKNLHGQCLHAYLLGFVHPTTGEEVVFSSPLPDEMEELLTALRARK